MGWGLYLAGCALLGAFIVFALEGMWSYIVVPILILLVLVRLSIPSKKKELREEQLKYYKKQNEEDKEE